MSDESPARGPMDDGWLHASVRLAAGGAMLAVVEVAVTLATGSRYFVSSGEVARYVFASVALIAAGVMAVGLCMRLLWRHAVSTTRGDAGTRLGRWVALLVCCVAALLLWRLTEGRRVRDVPGRFVWIGVVSALGGWVVATVTRMWVERDTGRVPSVRRRAGALLAVVAVAAVIANGLVLRRLYPAFHQGLTLIALGGTALAVQLLVPAYWPRCSSRTRITVVATGALVLATSLWMLVTVPSATSVVAEYAPMTGPWVRVVAGAKRAVSAPPLKSLPRRAAEPSTAGVGLRGSDVLLITVDALRADRLAAYGGGGLTPNLDQLATESVVFTRAYTPTPHTSYALASLMTGKFLRPVLALPQSHAEHPTLPELLRQQGYRTAAFYPPAIFFVDSERFASLMGDGFGFEYRKVMFASAQERVAQLTEYLAQAEPEQPLFVWVHLFEPHEPYEPDTRFFRGKSAVDRYDGEVAQVDDGVGALVRTFRQARARATVIVTADHGEEFGDHGGRFHGTTLFDEQVRVPLLWSSPGVAPHVISAPVETVDVATTLLASLGIARDARMRGDNLTAILADPKDRSAPPYAFSEVNDRRMATDGRYKLICRTRSAECSLFDLESDPRELRDVIATHGERAAELRGALNEFIATVPAIEFAARADVDGWPHALARAELGDRAAAPELIPLLGSSNATWRAAAARFCGEMGFAPCRQVVSALREQDPDAVVRAEASLASFALGDTSAQSAVVAVVADVERDRDVRLRAALRLSAVGDAAGARVLLDVALDSASVDVDREEAIEALGRLRSKPATSSLIALLDDVRLRTGAAAALGEIGGPTAKAALLRALATERYPLAREAQVRALMRLKDRRVVPALVTWLGTDTSVPSGVWLLEQLVSQARGSATVVRPSSLLADSRQGWQCDSDGCWPSSPQQRAGLSPVAVLRVPAPRGVSVARVTCGIEARGVDEHMTLGDSVVALSPGTQQVSVVLPVVRSVVNVPVSSTNGVRVQLVVVVAAREDPTVATGAGRGDGPP